MQALQISLLGKMEIRGQDGEGVVLPGKARELFAYLLLNRGQAISREGIACVLWDDASAFQAKKYLRQALWQLQSGLHGHGLPVDSPLLQIDSDWVGIHPSAPVWLDVEAFDGFCRQLRDLPGVDFDVSHASIAYAAVQLYGGELLTGCYREWCLIERERLQSLFLSLLDKLIDHCAAQFRFDEGIAHAMRALRIEPTRETTHRRLMRLHGRAGDRAAAMRQYQICKAILKRDFGVEPSERTRSVWAWIRDDSGLGKAARSPQPPAGPGTDLIPRIPPVVIDVGAKDTPADEPPLPPCMDADSDL